MGNASSSAAPLLKKPNSPRLSSRNFPMGNASSSAAPLLKKPVTETSSSCVTHSINGAHNFEVMNFSLLEADMDIGECVNSRNFSIGGFDWNICLYPAGRTTQEKKYVSVFLNPEGGGGQDNIRVRFTFTMFGKDGMVWAKRKTEHTFTSALDDGFGCPTFMYKSSLFRRLLRKSNDCFTIRCVLTVIEDPRVEDASSIFIPEPSVVRDLASMLKNGDGADVTFVVGDRSFPAHRCLLAARSAVFRAELFGPMKEKAARCVTIDDMEPSIFETLLYFVYTDSLPHDDDKDRNVPRMQHLLVAADRYGLDRLKAICEDRLCHAIDVKMVATTLTLAEQHHCEQLKDDCLWFIASRDVLGSVMKTDGYKHLVTSCPWLMKEILIRQDMARVISSESSSKVVF